MMNIKMERKVVLEGKFEDVITMNDHYYLVSKKHRVTVMPYMIDTKGLLDKIGVIKDYNYVFEEYDYTLINGYINQDDGTNLVAANRVLYEAIGLNLPNADDWMYLWGLYNNLTSDSAIDLYCVDVTNKNIKESEEVEQNKDKIHFKMIASEAVTTSDDTLLLAGYLRLFQYFYTNSLSKNSQVRPEQKSQGSLL